MLDPTPAGPKPTWSWYAPTLLAAPTIIALDQASKLLITELLSDQPGGARWVVEPYLKLRLVHNDGIVFGIFSGAFSSWVTILFVLAALTAVIVIFLRYLRRPTLAARVVLGCIIGGAIGNLVDRFRLGYVIDFVDLGWWPVFNLADSTINIAMGALVILLMLGKLDREPGPDELAQ